MTPGSSQLVELAQTSRNIQCDTSPGLPEPSVSWFIQAAHEDAIPITSGIESYTKTSGDLVAVTSTLNLTLNKSDHGKRIYCEASNIEGDTKRSTELTVIVLGRYCINFNQNV